MSVPPPTRPGTAGGAWLVVATCALVWWWREWFATGDGIHPFINFDALMYWLPLVREAAAQWRHGIVPLWNPYQALGTPLLAAMQVGAAYPLNALYLFVRAEEAWLIAAVLHHAIAGIGTYALCRTYALSPSAAVVGAASYMFSMLVLPKVFDQPQFICLAWIPGLFAAAVHLLRRPSAAAVTTLAVVWGMQILGGHPETIAYAAMLLGAYVAVELVATVRRAPTTALRLALACAAAAALAAGLTAFQWMPTLELVQRSVRTIGALTAAQQALGLADPPSLFFDAPSARAPLAIALLGVWLWGERRRAWFFAASAVLLLLLAAGPSTPFFALLKLLPTAEWFRAPGRWLNLWPLGVAVLTAAGADALISGAAADWRRVARTAAAVALLVFLCRLVLAHADVARTLIIGTTFDLLPVVAMLAMTYPAADRGAAAMRRIGPAAALALFCAAPSALRFTGPDFFSPRRIAEIYRPYAPLFEELRSQSPARVLSLVSIAGGHTWAKLGTYFEVPVLTDLEPLSTRDFQSFVAALTGPHPSWAWAVFMGEVSPPNPRFDARLLNLAGVRVVLADAHSAALLPQWFPDVDLRRTPRPDTAVVYDNRAAMPRAFFVGAAGARAAGADCVSRLQHPSFDPRRDLLVDEAAPAPATAAPAGPPPAVRIATYHPARVDLEVRAEEPGYVVLTDAFYPGWTATVDGAIAGIVRTDCFFRGVRVAPGAHRLTLRYAPLSARRGALIALGSAAGATVLLWVARRRSDPFATPSV